jgi:membrane-associated phospholipid phosphatase
MMRTAIGPFIVAAAVTILIGLGVKLDPWFPGDVAAARAVQSALPDPQPWALPVSVILAEQYGAESTKALFARPRPSSNLITVFGNPSGYSFPSTTMTFFTATFGTVGMLALMAKKAPYRFVIAPMCFVMLILGGVARVALGLHWPSDVLLTVVICLLWIWSLARVVLSAP